VEPGDLEEFTRRMTLLPSPVLGHDRTIEELDGMLAGGRLALTGNYFDGLAIEDCVLRSRAEWARVSAG
jgi:UDP-galactopyranose mutase